MALTLKVIPGYQFSENERLTQTKLNQLGRPTIDLQGAISSAAIGPGTITSDKLSPALITGLTPSPEPTPESRDLVMIHDVSENGLRNVTIGQILALGTPALQTITDVTLDDFAWIIRGAGADKNKQANLRDTLREAINGQSELLAVADLDRTADMLFVYDASAAAGTNKNRKVKIQTAVRTVTNTLIPDATVLSGAVDPALDELLLLDASSTAGDQQRRVKVQELVKQLSVSAIKAWVNFDGTTGTIKSQNNVSLVTRTQRGFYTITMATALANANYAILATSSRGSSGGTGITAFIDTTITMTVSNFGVRTKDGADDQDAPIVCVMVVQ
jgi:hypothetical protein